MKIQGNLLTEANSQFMVGNYQVALDKYINFSVVNPTLAEIVKINIWLCHKRLNKYNEKTVYFSDKPCVSVILPVHNVQEYIARCLESIINQTLENIEIIVIDDGSEDNSVPIILRYAAKDQRIVFIQNIAASGNSGTPRNQALERANGEYVAFVDADDWIDPDMLSELYKKGKESGSDIVSSGGFFRELMDGSTEQVKTNNYIFGSSLQKNRKDLFLSPHFPIVWFRIYKLDLIVKNRIKFGETKTSADLPFAFKALFTANSIKAIPLIYYHYRFDRPGSTIDRRKGKGAFEVFKAYKNIIQFLEKKKSLKEPFDEMFQQLILSQNFFLTTEPLLIYFYAIFL